MSEGMVKENGGKLGVMSQGQSKGCSGGRSLERSLDKRGPNDRRGRGRSRGRCYTLGNAGLDQLSTLSHVPVMLDYSLDDLVLLEV